MFAVREEAEISIGQRRAVVTVERQRCEKCGEIFYSPAQMDAAQRAASDEIRRQSGLLTPTQIRALRGKYGLSQVQFEQLLGVGPKTVVRWERGTVFQNRATDELLRVIDGVPGAFEFVARRNGLVYDPTLGTAHRAGPAKVNRYSSPDAPPLNGPAAVYPFPGKMHRQQPHRVAAEREMLVPKIPSEALK